MRRILRHTAFRICVAIASLALTVSLLLGVADNIALMTPYARLSQSERQVFFVTAAAFCLPLLMGIFVVLPQGRTWVRATGYLIIFGASPIAAFLLLWSGCIGFPSEEFFWSLCWLATAIGYWLALRPEQDGPPTNMKTRIAAFALLLVTQILTVFVCAGLAIFLSCSLDRYSRETNGIPVAGICTAVNTIGFYSAAIPAILFVLGVIWLWRATPTCAQVALAMACLSFFLAFVIALYLFAALLPWYRGYATPGAS
jgi:hypothetical protein